MIFPKVLLLSLLLISSFACARVQLHTQAELINSTRYGNHSTDIIFQIDAHESLEVYNHGKVMVVAELLAENENIVTVCFNIYAKNGAGDYEKTLAPVLMANYKDSSTLSMGSGSEIFTMLVTAQKVVSAQ